ncbi:MAG: hypothetical protein HY925_04290 [Elusimicrobia bacterium]|nr:hypothetical protein [Elusimicrobiota bacterium]
MVTSILLVLAANVGAAGADRFPPPLAAADPAGLADRFRLNATPLKWRELLAPGARVVFVGDSPTRRQGKLYLAAMAGDLAAAGVTHLALELPASRQPDLDAFCSGRDEGRVREALWQAQGLEAGDGSLRLLRAACTAGLRLMALDPREDDSPRCPAMAARLAGVLEGQPGTRVLAVLSRPLVAERAQPAALRKLGFSTRSYAFLTPDPDDRKYYQALDAAGLRASALLLPCPGSIGAQGCLAVPSVLDER